MKQNDTRTPVAACCVQARGCHIVSSSPEILCRVDNSRVVTNRPLAGTRPRGKDTEADKALEVRVGCRCRLAYPRRVRDCSRRAHIALHLQEKASRPVMQWVPCVVHIV